MSHLFTIVPHLPITRSYSVAKGWPGLRNRRSRGRHPFWTGARRGKRETEGAVRVLIVDDDETTCQLLAEILDQEGMEAVWTVDSISGQDMALHRAYDLYIFDVVMPSLPGTELATRLKAHSPSASIILISAFADAALRQTATGLGVTLLSKPFTPEQLLAVIPQALAGR